MGTGALLTGEVALEECETVVSDLDEVPVPDALAASVAAGGGVADHAGETLLERGERTPRRGDHDPGVNLNQKLIENV